MKLKKFISFLLALTLIATTFACGIVANAASYSSSVLQYMLDNHESYPDARYTPESYAVYTAALANAQSVAANSSASAEDINNAVSALAGAEAGLTVINTEYKSAIDVRAASSVVSGKSITIAFKDVASNELSNITLEVTNAVVANEFRLEPDGYYYAIVTSTGATGDVITATITYDCLGETYTSYVNVLTCAEGEHVALIARETAKN